MWIYIQDVFSLLDRQNPSPTLRPTHFQRCVVKQLLTGARQTIALTVTCRKCNKNSPERLADVYRSIRGIETPCICIFSTRAGHRHLTPKTLEQNQDSSRTDRPVVTVTCINKHSKQASFTGLLLL